MLLRIYALSSGVDYVADTARNPFGLSPPCESSVPGYGDPNADFHVIGDHPGIHGGVSTGIPFTDRDWSARFFETLCESGLIQGVDLDAELIDSNRTFFSYLHMCVPDESPPDADSYTELEPFFDAELRAITAHVLFPVGARATAHTLRNYTATDPGESLDMDAHHAREIQGSGWLVVPIKDPAEWTAEDRTQLCTRINSFEQIDYRQVSDLGRFIAGADPYLVR